ncbi:HTH_48 domain-containing protein [Trichonephila clavata]|uniref:HTH_48 domain-containing protein n=1 Tax=Trichonephila clavata TaxID=2740835 RepID=A0A8X6I0V4_TRICU|nr:HTH_48 domain-containing protein [Trichonephila clavata]
MSDGMVRKWVRAFKDGRTNVHDEERSGRPLVVNEDLVQKVDEKVRETDALQFHHCPTAFLNVLVVFCITCDRELELPEIVFTLGSKNVDGFAQNPTFSSALTFLERYHNEGEDFLDQLVTGDETWVAYVTPESKQQSMEWRHSSSPKRVKFKQTISAGKSYAQFFWDMKGVL